MAAARRSASNVAPATGGPDWWRRYLLLGGPRCAYCRRDVGFERLTRDHVLPRSRGGREAPENVLPACGSCNRKKRSRRLRDFAPSLEASLDPPPSALPAHALGAVEDGAWVWSRAARAVQAEARPGR